MGKKGRRSTKGQAETDWGQPKTVRVSAAVTPTAKRLLEWLSLQWGMSISEMIERWSRAEARKEALRLTEAVEPQTIAQLIETHWIALVEESDIEVDRLQKLKEGGDRPTEAERLLIAAALKLDESVVLKLAEHLSNGDHKLHS